MNQNLESLKERDEAKQIAKQIVRLCDRENVAFVARGAHLAAIREHGLRVRGAVGRCALLRHRLQQFLRLRRMPGRIYCRWCRRLVFIGSFRAGIVLAAGSHDNYGSDSKKYFFHKSNFSMSKQGFIMQVV